MIRAAKRQEIDRLLEIYDIARVYMAENGNPTQWPQDYPGRMQLERDIEHGSLYVMERDGKIHAVFALIIGEDDTYAGIEGAWRNDDRYGTIHRMASDGKTRGVFRDCLHFCRQKIGNLRIDTHEQNAAMRHLITKHGFEECGVIYVGDGTPRIAYQHTGKCSNDRRLGE